MVLGRHEMILPAKFKGAAFDNSVLGIVEPSPGFAERHDLLLARVLAQPKDDMVPVRVINPSPVPVTLYQNTSIGNFSQKMVLWDQPVATGLQLRSRDRQSRWPQNSSVWMP